MKIVKRIIGYILKFFKWSFLVLLVTLILSAIYNLTLPKESNEIEYLDEQQKTYLAELIHLKNNIGNSVWPGWGNAEIPVIVYNEKYAFLVGYSDPSPGWVKMPGNRLQGSEWELVKKDDFLGQSYYRQMLPDPTVTPQNFTVKVGDRWVATLQTREYSEVAFYQGFRKDLPPVINAVFPYRLFWNLLMGEAENYVGAIAHEAFHALQGTIVSNRLISAENIAAMENKYNWEDINNAEGWRKEVELLMKAYKTDNIDSAKIFAGEFIKIRDNRRSEAKFTNEMIQYEKEREWLEGLAKYAEIKIGVTAQKNKQYVPLQVMGELSDFHYYSSRIKFFNKQLDEVKRTVRRDGESRFYYVGMLQAEVLDKLKPDWKERAFNENIYLENLLAEVANKTI